MLLPNSRNETGPSSTGRVRMPSAMASRKCVDRLGRGEAERHARLELGHEVVVVRVEPLGHVQRGDFLGAAGHGEVGRQVDRPARPAEPLRAPPRPSRPCRARGRRARNRSRGYARCPAIAATRQCWRRRPRPWPASSSGSRFPCQYLRPPVSVPAGADAGKAKVCGDGHATCSCTVGNGKGIGTPEGRGLSSCDSAFADARVTFPSCNVRRVQMSARGIVPRYVRWTVLDPRSGMKRHDAASDLVIPLRIHGEDHAPDDRQVHRRRAGGDRRGLGHPTPTARPARRRLPRRLEPHPARQGRRGRPGLRRGRQPDHPDQHLRGQSLHPGPARSGRPGGRDQPGGRGDFPPGGRRPGGRSSPRSAPAA